MAHEAVKIRTPRRDWIGFLVAGGIWLVNGGISLALDTVLTLGRPWNGTLGLAIGCLLVAEALWIRTLGVDLTQESANVRGIRRRSVPWQEVQAVVHRRWAGTWCVRLIVESGKPVTLRAPTTWLGIGAAEYERDFDRIGQWWLAHRGESWRPLRPEAPRPPVQE